MIDRVRWAQLVRSEAAGPFARGGRERPIRITFHDSTLVRMPAEEDEPLKALRQLSGLPEVDVVYTAGELAPCLRIGGLDGDSDEVLLSVEYEGGRTVTSRLPGLQQWRRLAASLVGRPDERHADVKAMLEDLVAARAHITLKRDILVTLSPRLLTHRAKTPVRDANPLAPSEAAKVVGLFLRSRDNYTHTLDRQLKMGFDRGLFYLVLARHRLPSMWRYFAACVHAGKMRGDDTPYLGQSVLIRCVRALQARDAIGVQFYLPQDNNVRDAMMYHFDYLTLVLVGAIDAQARVAHRAYRLVKPIERHASFRNPKFRSQLGTCGAGQLHSLSTGQHFQDVMTLLSEPRNTIHGANLPTLAYQRGGEPQESFVHIPPQCSQALWDAAGRTGSPDKWGLTRDFEVLLEPYTYSVTLVDESFKLIDQIAGATEVLGLFPQGFSIPNLIDSPPDDNVFGQQIRERLNVLG
jgi:hypothetical protein